MRLDDLPGWARIRLRRRRPGLGGAHCSRHLPEQARLADAWLRDQRHDLPPACRRFGQCPLDRSALGVPPDERRQPPGRRRLEAGPSRARTDQLVRLNLIVEPLDRRSPERAHLDESLDERNGGGAEQRAVRRRTLLHPLRQVDRRSHGAVVPELRVREIPDDHPAAVDPDPDLDGRAVLPAYLLGVRAAGVQHRQRREAGPQRVVLVRDRRAEQRQQAVAQLAADRPLVPLDGLHHPLYGAVQQPLGLLVVQALDQRRRADDVGEEDRDLLALAFRGVGTGSGTSATRGGAGRSGAARRGRRRRRGRDRLAALHTESGGLGELSAARRAPPGQRLPAPHAEPGLGRVLRAARRALHRLPSPSGAGPGRRHSIGIQEGIRAPVRWLLVLVVQEALRARPLQRGGLVLLGERAVHQAVVAVDSRAARRTRPAGPLGSRRAPSGPSRRPGCPGASRTPPPGRSAAGGSPRRSGSASRCGPARPTCSSPGP